jgi:hypothetical protein
LTFDAKVGSLDYAKGGQTATQRELGNLLRMLKQDSDFDQMIK